MKKDTNNVELDIKIPKKRGRKPKNFNLEMLSQQEEVTEPEKKIPKKRGRKPKNYIAPVEEVKVPKKRGRKPMLSQVTATNKNMCENFLTRDNVLHLKINSNEVNNNILLETLYKYNPDINEPEPYDPNNAGLQSLEDNEEEDGKTKSHNYSTQKQEESENFPIITENTVSNDLVVEEKDINYNNILNSENLNTESNNNNNAIGGIKSINKTNNKRKSNAIMIYYNEYNKRKEWPKNSSLNCFWCCHTFNNTPCALPTKIKNDIFYVFGNFCSKECCAAYNFESGDNSNNIWERYTLLNYLYSMIEENPDLRIKLAPHRMTLEMFGGNLSIEEFRETFNTNKKYKVVFPPMVSIIPSVEENSKTDNKRNDAYYIPIDKERIKKVNNDLRLKRKNPINSRNTLENCMRLRYT